MKGQNKKIAFIALGFFAIVGAYNAVVINSDSHLSDNEMKFAKRLDEVLGVTVEGRKVASTTKWQKLTPSKVLVEKAIEKAVNEAPVVAEAPAFEELTPAAAVKENLNLTLVEVINPKLWEKGLNNTQFSGAIATNEGVIETLDVALPGASFSASFSEMTGNVFEYEMNGEAFSGMMYQVDQNAYMVTLTNGPLEGTRFRFSTETPREEQARTEELLAEQNIEINTFGQEPVESYDNVEAQQELASGNNAQPMGFNL